MLIYLLAFFLCFLSMVHYLAPMYLDQITDNYDFILRMIQCKFSLATVIMINVHALVMLIIWWLTVHFSIVISPDLYNPLYDSRRIAWYIWFNSWILLGWRMYVFQYPNTQIRNYSHILILSSRMSSSRWRINMVRLQIYCLTLKIYSLNVKYLSEISCNACNIKVHDWLNI